MPRLLVRLRGSLGSIAVVSLLFGATAGCKAARPAPDRKPSAERVNADIQSGIEAHISSEVEKGDGYFFAQLRRQKNSP